jgi:hypothetical protein
MESKLDQILTELTKGHKWREAMEEKLGKLSSGLTLPTSPSFKGEEDSANGAQSSQDHPATTKDNLKSTNPSGESGNSNSDGKDKKSLLQIPPSYSQQESPFDPDEDEDEELGNQAFPQCAGGLSPQDPALATDYEELARCVHGVRLDPDCVWRKASGFKGEYAKEVAALKKTFLCLEVSLKTLSAYVLGPERK